jgi:hypothetical protein
MTRNALLASSLVLSFAVGCDDSADPALDAWLEEDVSTERITNNTMSAPMDECSRWNPDCNDLTDGVDSDFIDYSPEAAGEGHPQIVAVDGVRMWMVVDTGTQDVGLAATLDDAYSAAGGDDRALLFGAAFLGKGEAIEKITIGDLNHDGFDDLIAYSGSHVYVRLGQLTGFTTTVTEYSSISAMLSAIAKDGGYTLPGSGGGSKTGA